MCVCLSMSLVGCLSSIHLVTPWLWLGLSGRAKVTKLARSASPYRSIKLLPLPPPERESRPNPTNQRVGVDLDKAVSPHAVAGYLHATTPVLTETGCWRCEYFIVVFV